MSQIPIQKQNLKEQIQLLQKQSLELDLKLLYTQTGLDQQPVIQKSMPQLQSLLLNKLKNQENNINWPSLNPSTDISLKITKLQESYDEIESFTHQLLKKIDNIKQDESYFKIQKLNYQSLPKYLEKFNEFQLQSIAFSNSFQNKSDTQRFKEAIRGRLPQKNVSQQTFNLIETNISSQSQRLKNSKKSEQYLKAIKLQLIDMNISNICNDFYATSNLNFYKILSQQFNNYQLNNQLDSSQIVYNVKREMLNNTVQYLEDSFWENNLIKYLNSKHLVSGISQYLEEKYFSDYENGIRKQNTYFHDCLVNDIQIPVCVWGVIYLLLRSGKYQDIIDLIEGTFSQFETINQSLNSFHQNLKIYCIQKQILNDDQRYQILTQMTNDMCEDSQCVFKLQVYDILTRRGQSQDAIFTKDIEEYLWISLKQVIVNVTEEEAQSNQRDFSDKSRTVSPIDWYFLKDFQVTISERQDCSQLQFIENLCTSFLYLNAFKQMQIQVQQKTMDTEDLIHFSLIILASQFYDMHDNDQEIDQKLKLDMQRICEMFISKKFESDLTDGFYYSLFLYNHDRQNLFEIVSENIIKSKEIKAFINSEQQYMEFNKILDQLEIYQDIYIHIADKLRKYKQNYSHAITIYDNFNLQIPLVQCISEYCAYFLQGDSNIEEYEYKNMEIFIENFFIHVNKIIQVNQQNDELYKQIRIASYLNFIKTLVIHSHGNTIEQGCQFYNFILNRANDLNILPEINNNMKMNLAKDLFLYLNQANYLNFYLDLWVSYTEQAQIYIDQFQRGIFIKNYTLTFQQLADQISFYHSYFNEICNNYEQDFNKLKARTHKIKDKFLQISNYI